MFLLTLKYYKEFNNVITGSWPPLIVILGRFSVFLLAFLKFVRYKVLLLTPLVIRLHTVTSNNGQILLSFRKPQLLNLLCKVGSTVTFKSSCQKIYVSMYFYFFSILFLYTLFITHYLLSYSELSFCISQIGFGIFLL